MGRKAYGSHRDSRVAEMPEMVYGPGFFARKALLERNEPLADGYLGYEIVLF